MTDRKREDENQKEGRHLYPKKPQEVILRGEAHEQKDSGGRHYHKTYNEPSLGISHDECDGLPRQSEPEQSQITDQNGSANKGQSQKMDARDDRKQPRRAAHRDQRRGELNPSTELEQRHSSPPSTTHEQINDRGVGRPATVEPICLVRDHASQGDHCRP